MPSISTGSKTSGTATEADLAQWCHAVDALGDGFEPLVGVAHGDAKTSGLEHGNVVVAVADGEHPRRQPAAQPLETGGGLGVRFGGDGETRLEEVLRDIDRETVDFRPNFDGNTVDLNTNPVLTVAEPEEIEEQRNAIKRGRAPE